MHIDPFETIISKILGIFEIMLLLAATYYLYKIYTFNRLNKKWLLFPMMTLFFAFRHFLILIKFNFIEELIVRYILFDQVFVPFMISLFILLGVYDMLKKFESFEIIEKQTHKKTVEMYNRKKMRQ